MLTKYLQKFGSQFFALFFLVYSRIVSQYISFVYNGGRITNDKAASSTQKCNLNDYTYMRLCEVPMCVCAFTLDFLMIVVIWLAKNKSPKIDPHYLDTKIVFSRTHNQYVSFPFFAWIFPSLFVPHCKYTCPKERPIFFWFSLVIHVSGIIAI